jgi:endonuclease/exonuclease/phosphatase family metal-dependent hydrolase
MRLLTWNLYHGRAVPGAGRSLAPQFARALDGWEWDVALLQEVPPWWGPLLERETGAQVRRALTSRNWAPAVQARLGARFPDLLKSGAGGANMLAVRGVVVEHRRATLCWWPERRVVHAVRLGDGVWVANLHATVRDDARAGVDIARARAATLTWAACAPLVIGGDFNVRTPWMPGFVQAAAHRVDQVFVRGLRASGAAQVLDAGQLSDHAPVAVALRVGE